MATLPLIERRLCRALVAYSSSSSSIFSSPSFIKCHSKNAKAPYFESTARAYSMVPCLPLGA
ncbi:hypothetical protein PanWU01x14_033700 [Parasponia andersonii]|uniref:Uncharacterized protein n=1 Tax=Parasponia andersonii TaxID=3476 RepID=A0A2P5DTR2_PARAD|nr:hypothetical protein PanWU01x14_033700 [Parasponia andersonii]